MDDKLELHGEWEKRDGGGLGDWKWEQADGPTGAYWGGSVG